MQGVIQVQPKNADWLYRAGHAGEWIDPISHAHINLVTGLTMLVAGALFALAPLLGGTAPPRRLVEPLLLAPARRLAGVLRRPRSTSASTRATSWSPRATPEQAEEATPLHPFLIMGAGIAMLAGFWMLLWLVVRSVLALARPGPAVRPRRLRRARGRARCRGRCRRSRP